MLFYGRIQVCIEKNYFNSFSLSFYWDNLWFFNERSRFGAIWSLLSCLLVYGGTIQLLMVGLLKANTPIISMGLISLIVNSRHMFYGLSFLQEFKKIRKESFLKFFYLCI